MIILVTLILYLPRNVILYIQITLEMIGFNINDVLFIVGQSIDASKHLFVFCGELCEVRYINQVKKK